MRLRVAIWAGLLGLSLAAGGCQPVEHEFDLSFTNPGNDCTAATLQEVRYVTVELYGLADQSPCALARRCVPVQMQTIDEMVETLAEANQPLVDVSDDDAHIVAVIGHSRGCLDETDKVLCGDTDVANADGRALEVPLSCGACSTAEIPFCP
ncbi:hypothetical protein [Haliangium sp.]